MGLARKGSRRIKVAGRDYRWVVSPDSGFLVMVAELDAEPGQRLEAQFEYSSAEARGTSTALTPSTVRATIEQAREAGWQPTKRGLPPFKLRMPEHIDPGAPNKSLERTRDR